MDPVPATSAEQTRRALVHAALRLFGTKGFDGTSTRGQFGVQRNGRRAGRVVSFHDTHNGRYLRQLKPSSDGRKWCTITPVDNHRLAASIWELLQEV